MSLELACTFVACDCNFEFGGHTYKKLQTFHLLIVT